MQADASPKGPRAHYRRAGQLVQRGERTWLVRIFLGRDGAGRRRYHNRTVRGTKKDALGVLNSLLTDNDRGTLIEPSRETLDSFLDRWLRDVASVRVRGNTLDQYRQTLKLYVRPILGRVRICDLELTDVNRLYRGMEARGLSSRTVRLTHAVVCGALEHAVVKEQTLLRNPARRAELPRARKPKIIALTSRQLARLRAAASTDANGVVLLFAVATGMRPSEYLALQWKDLELDACTATVVRSIHRAGPGEWRYEEPKTQSSRRTVTFPPTLAKALRAHRASQAKRRIAAGSSWQDHDLVFCTEIGTPINVQNLKNRSFKPILEEAGIPSATRLYDLRHTMATLLIDEGVDPRTVADRLGHSSVATTLGTYVHPPTEMQAKAARRLEDILFTRRGAAPQRRSPRS
jgi:integrase